MELFFTEGRKGREVFLVLLCDFFGIFRINPMKICVNLRNLWTNKSRLRLCCTRLYRVFCG